MRLPDSCRDGDIPIASLLYSGEQWVKASAVETRSHSSQALLVKDAVKLDVSAPTRSDLRLFKPDIGPLRAFNSKRAQPNDTFYLRVNGNSTVNVIGAVNGLNVELIGECVGMLNVTLDRFAEAEGLSQEAVLVEIVGRPDGDVAKGFLSFVGG